MAGAGAVGAGAACGSTATTTKPTTETRPAPPPPPRRVLLTIASAGVDGTKPDGSPWDDPKQKASPVWGTQEGPLSAYLTQHPELDGAEKTVGQPVEAIDVVEAATTSPGPDPQVFVEAAGRVFRTPARAGQFQPVWQFALTLDLAADALVRITVVDWDGASSYDVIGETTVAASQLLGARVLDVPRFGNVDRLSLAVGAAPEPVKHRVSVPGRHTWTDTGIAVVAGQELQIVATGQVCTRASDRCSGPEGQAATSDYNVRGFEQRGHGTLVGALGDVRFAIGRERRFSAPSSGTLLLGVNDRDTSNNQGEFEVSVALK
jgi:hypothetical protein